MINPIDVLKRRKKGIKAYIISGLIFTVWNLFWVWLLVDYKNWLSGVMFIIVITPITWAFKLTIYYLTGFTKKDNVICKKCGEQINEN